MTCWTCPSCGGFGCRTDSLADDAASPRSYECLAGVEGDVGRSFAARRHRPTVSRAGPTAKLDEAPSRTPARPSSPESWTIYRVDWEYEPRTFPILWNTEGKVVESFSPDFYLPELDIYVELTTLNQSLVRARIPQAAPAARAVPDAARQAALRKDFRALMLKYGRFDCDHSAASAHRHAIGQVGARGGRWCRPAHRRCDPCRAAVARSAAGASARRRRAARVVAASTAYLAGGTIELMRTPLTPASPTSPIWSLSITEDQLRVKVAELGAQLIARLQRPVGDPRLACSRARCRSWPT